MCAESKGFFSKCARVYSLQSKDNQAPRLDGDGWGREAEGSQDAATVQSFNRGPPMFSLDVQEVALFQAEPGLVLVEKALEGLDVHCVVQIHHVLSWILNFWHSDRLPNCNRTVED